MPLLAFLNTAPQPFTSRQPNNLEVLLEDLGRGMRKLIYWENPSLTRQGQISAVYTVETELHSTL